MGKYLAASHILGPASPPQLSVIWHYFWHFFCQLINKVNHKKNKNWQQIVGNLPYSGPSTSAVRLNFLAFLSVCLSLYQSQELLSSVCYMSHLLPKVSARFVQHRTSLSRAARAASVCGCNQRGLSSIQPRQNRPQEIIYPSIIPKLLHDVMYTGRAEHSYWWPERTVQCLIEVVIRCGFSSIQPRQNRSRKV